MSSVSSPQFRTRRGSFDVTYTNRTTPTCLPSDVVDDVHIELELAFNADVEKDEPRIYSQKVPLYCPSFRSDLEYYTQVMSVQIDAEQRHAFRQKTWEAEAQPKRAFDEVAKLACLLGEANRHFQRTYDESQTSAPSQVDEESDFSMEANISFRGPPAFLASGDNVRVQSLAPKSQSRSPFHELMEAVADSLYKGRQSPFGDNSASLVRQRRFALAMIASRKIWDQTAANNLL